jgi:hypothetical protein
MSAGSRPIFKGMPEPSVQILEVRADDVRPLTITVAVTSDAASAIHTALSEQLDRRRQEPVESPEDVAELREEIALVDRFAELAAAGAHGIVSLSQDELQSSLMGLTRYADRVDGEHFQPAELRERLLVIQDALASMWDANAAAAEAQAAASLTGAAPH